MVDFAAAITAAAPTIVGYVGGALVAGVTIGILMHGAHLAWGAFKSIR